MGHKPIPLSLESFVAYIVLQARVNLETDWRLDVVAFVGNSASREQVSMRWDLRSEEAKDDSAEDIRKVAAMANADFVLMVQEAWGLEPSKMAEYPAIVERYGSLSAYPPRLDAAAFTLETTLVVGRRKSPSRRRGFPRKSACAPWASRSSYLLPKPSDISAH